MKKKSITKILKEAVTSHQRDDLQRAEKLYLEVLGIDDENVDALHFLGLLRYHQGNLVEAQDYMLAAIGLNPGYFDAYLNLGNVFLKTGAFENAQKCYAKALELQPRHIGAATNFGVTARYLGELEKSAAILEQVCKDQPNWADGYYNLANTYLKQNQLDKALTTVMRSLEVESPLPDSFALAIKLGRRLGKFDLAAKAIDLWQATAGESSELSHLRASLTGENVPSQASDNYVRSVFDRYANSFEASLKSLDYQGPAHLARSLMQSGLAKQRNLTVLDAGCGTGLCHSVLKPLAAELIGIDLSSKMLDHARFKGGYTTLLHASLDEALDQFENYFDMIVSMDVLIYFGDLMPIMKKFNRAAKTGSTMFFSLERTDESDFILTDSGRYAHSQDYVISLLSSIGFEVSISQIEIRMEFGRAVDGLMVTALKL